MGNYSIECYPKFGRQNGNTTPIAAAILTFFDKNGINFSEPVVYLNSSQILGNFPPTPTLNVVFNMLPLMSDFVSYTLFEPETNMFLAFEKTFSKSQPWYSYKLYSYKGKSVYVRGWFKTHKKKKGHKFYV